MAANPFQRILVGVELDAEAAELTPGSRRAVEEALWLASEERSELVFLHSSFHDETRDPIGARAYVIGQGVSGPGVAVLEGLAVQAKARNLQASVEIVPQRPLLALVQRVLRGGVDLVVVGKRNRLEKDTRRLGSLAAKLLRKCPGPVWVVRPERGEHGEVVLAATDLSPVGGDAVQQAARLARLAGRKLHVVHAWSLPFELIHEEGRVAEEEHRRKVAACAERARGAVEAQLAGTGMERSAELHVGCTSPERGIREAVERLRPAVLVMGTISRGGVAGLLVGNTAERLLGDVDCSILAVKPLDFVSPIRLEDQA